jgi:hypothetical protein
MVKKDMDSEESAISFVEASGTAAAAWPSYAQEDGDYRTVGAAIQLLEAKLKRCSTDEPRKDTPISGKILVLPTIVSIGIVSAIHNGFGTHESVGKLSSEKALVPGNVVALLNSNSSNQHAFLRACNGKVDFGGGSRPLKDLPFDWDSERFLIVDAGHGGQVAFYNISHRLFLGIDPIGNATVSNGNCSVTSLDDRPRGNESFLPLTKNGGIQLYCVTLNRTLHVSNSSYITFSVVQIRAFE